MPSPPTLDLECTEKPSHLEKKNWERDLNQGLLTLAVQSVTNSTPVAQHFHWAITSLCNH